MRILPFRCSNLPGEGLDCFICLEVVQLLLHGRSSTGAIFKLRKFFFQAILDLVHLQNAQIVLVLCNLVLLADTIAEYKVLRYRLLAGAADHRVSAKLA